MSILWRSWITFTSIIATVLIVLALLSCLQHNALYSNLIRQRLAVVAQTVAGSFQPVVNLGLPISMLRNAREVLVRAQKTDSRITAIHAFGPAGIIVQTTDPEKPNRIPDEVKLAQSLAGRGGWSAESEAPGLPLVELKAFVVLEPLAFEQRRTGERTACKAPCVNEAVSAAAKVCSVGVLCTVGGLDEFEVERACAADEALQGGFGRAVAQRSRDGLRALPAEARRVEPQRCIDVRCDDGRAVYLESVGRHDFRR